MSLIRSPRVLHRSDGFTLLELVIVITIASALLAIVTMNFNSMTKKYQIESQVKQMQADFDNIRLKAVTTKKKYTVVVNPGGYLFRCYSSDADTVGVVTESKTVKYPMQQYLSGGSGSYDTLSDYVLTFDTRGCMSCLTGSDPFYLAVSPTVNGPSVNVVAVQTAKTNVGIIQGGTCVLK
ncbi:prepilin-type N-terminal cleavage/methylation domain-containing protein [Geomonas sp. Red32]|uniref:prepilin-type N-terminal cleavage/methylation domain-containing protein n=1 Tax=Geomonas sp. Red32 TaxID=2912856 RepID=UPI00202CEDD0|nr:prepilin-type N-terminal cleavage/methylation domain-containing protein [Geomonas sp. Red32]MCM0083696.1 prepilin-type N-terminal cleavage/methylation domain-containing protein [Geomonas sp. Red32]